jgi:hypothetical protein
MTTLRNAKGQYVIGHGGGPGRPSRPREMEYLGALTDAVPLKEWKLVVSKALRDAKDGDAKAREWLGKYLLGDDPVALLELAEEVATVKELLKEYRDANNKQHPPRITVDQGGLGEEGADGPVADPGCVEAGQRQCDAVSGSGAGPLAMRGDEVFDAEDTPAL